MVGCIRIAEMETHENKRKKKTNHGDDNDNDNKFASFVCCSYRIRTHPFTELIKQCQVVNSIKIYAIHECESNSFFFALVYLNGGNRERVKSQSKKTAQITLQFRRVLFRNSFAAAATSILLIAEQYKQHTKES